MSFEEDVGTVAIILFAISSIYVVVYFIFKYSRKLPDERFSKLKEFIRVNFLKYKRILSYIHYLAGIGAIVILLVHGIGLVGEDEGAVIIGWITAGVYLVYIFTGLIIWLKIKPLWEKKSIRRIFSRVHRSLLLFAGIVIIHIIHVLIAD